MNERCLVIHRKYYLILPLLAALVAVISYFAWDYYRRTDERRAHDIVTNTKNQLSLQQFVELAKKRRISRTEIYYLPFLAETFSPLSEEGLVYAPRVRISSDELIYYHPDHILNTLDGFKEQRHEEMPVNFRYCCLVYSGPDKIIRFSLTYHPEMICINGIPYKVPIETFDAFLKLLPVIDYELAVKELGLDNKTAESN